MFPSLACWGRKGETCPAGLERGTCSTWLGRGGNMPGKIRKGETCIG